MAIKPIQTDRIIQIIPALPNMWARWKPTGEKDEPDTVEFGPVACLALIENSYGQSVVPMSIDSDGEIDNVWEFTNFGGIVFAKDPYKEVDPDGN